MLHERRMLSDVSVSVSGEGRVLCEERDPWTVGASREKKDGRGFSRRAWI